MFYDLCFRQETENQFVAKDKMAMAILLGYDCTAVNRIISNSDSLNRSPMEDAKTAPELMQSLGPWVQSALLSHQGLVRPAGLPPRQMAQLTRITFEGDQGIAAAAAALQGIRCAGLRQTFDIVAVKPNCASSLVKACQALDVDIVTLDLSVRLGVRNAVASLAAAVQRGIHFELLYRPAVAGDDRGRTLFFARAKRLCQVLRGRNIILSSGAEAAFDLRGPYDIINIASLLGLSTAEAKAAISSRCEAVLRHAAEAKRHGISVTTAATAPPRQIAAQTAAEESPPQQLQVSEPPQTGAEAQVEQAAELHLAAPERAVPTDGQRPAKQTLPAITEQRLPLEPGQLAEPPAPETSQGPRQCLEDQQRQEASEDQQRQEASEEQQRQAASEHQQRQQQQMVAEVSHPVSNMEQSQLQPHQAQLHLPGSAMQQFQGGAAGSASGSGQLADRAPNVAAKVRRKRREWKGFPWASKKQSAAGLRAPTEVASQPTAVAGVQASGDMGSGPATAQIAEPEPMQGSGTSGGGAEGNVDPALAQPSKKKRQRGRGSGLGVLTAMFKPKQGKSKKKKKKKK